MRATALQHSPRRVRGRLEMRWRVLGAVLINLALWGVIITLIRMLPR